MTEELPELELITAASVASAAEEPAEPSGAPAGAPTAPGAAHAMSAGMGLPCPAYNAHADKEYYRFLLAGLVMLIGSLMPWGVTGSELVPGYWTIGGAFALLISIGMVWTWWGAISTGRFTGRNLKWVFLSLLPFLLQLHTLIGSFLDPAMQQFLALKGYESGWKPLAMAFIKIQDVEKQAMVRDIVTMIGPGRLVFVFGALLAELFFVMAVFGGAKHAKAQKVARQAAKPAGRSGARRR
ncbi:MAG: hypothetical protein IPM29_16105 [Planctomycetes bacterium]|nr:hypothetical protein [Planctomycetota bacterium]